MSEEVTGATPATATVATPPATPTSSVRRVGKVEVVVGAVVVVALILTAGWFGWRQLRGTPATLDVDGARIANASAVLSDAETELRRLVTLDGAPLQDGAGCWFGPLVTDALRPGPRLACGPVMLGIAGDDEHWLVDSPRWIVADDPSGSPRATATFTGFDGVERLRPLLLGHPDGLGSPGDAPVPGAKGLRAEAGGVVTGLQSTIAEADVAFQAAARTSRASVDRSAGCFVAAREATRAGATILVSEEQVWCGPVLLPDSGPDEFWATYGLSHSGGDSIVEATAAVGSIDEVGETVALPADLVLYRPDGAKPPVDVGTLTRPDPDPVVAGTVRLLDALPAELELTAPDDGRLITPVVSGQVTGLGRVPRIGTGATAVVAPPGQELVLATFAATRPDDAPSSGWTATVVAGSVPLPVPGWDDVADVTLDVLFGERTQRLSLVTGERAPGAPAVLYRERTTVGVGASSSATATLPKGDPVQAPGAVARADLQAWAPDKGWAPDGQAYLMVTVEDWALDRPCCEVTDLKVSTLWELLLPDGTKIRADGDTGTTVKPVPVFEVPEGLSDAELGLLLTATFTADNEPGRGTGRGTMNLELPS